MTPSAPSRADWSAATGDALERLRQAGLTVARNQPLAPFTTYRVGGPAAGFLSIASVAELETVRSVRSTSELAILVVGNGSNLLVADRGFDGLVLHLSDAFDEIAIGERSAETGRVSVRLGGATLLPIAARATVRAGLGGFEWAVGVPGTVGGGVAMNAGGHGSDVAASLVRCSVFNLRNGGPFEWAAADLRFGYRQSALASDDLVLYAELALELGDRARSESLLADIVRWRREHQPGGANAGSVFANPPRASSVSPDQTSPDQTSPDQTSPDQTSADPGQRSAGRLIDEAGLKGFRIGTAAVSTKHANFIQADAGGAADDVYRVLRHVQHVVFERTGITLRPENRLVGFDDGPSGETR